MVPFSSAPVDPTDVLQKSKMKVMPHFRNQSGTVNLQPISSAILDIQQRLRPKRALPDHLKRRFFFLRVALIERLILGLYHALTKDQKEISYQLTLVCQDLVNTNLALQEQITALSHKEEKN